MPLELALRVAAYPEPLMRRIALAEWLGRLPPATAARWVADILRKGREGGPPFDLALVAFTSLLEDPRPLGYEGLAEIYRAAREQGLDDLAALFFSSGVAMDSEAPPQRVLESADGRPLTLGERKTLARRSGRPQIERLLRDPDASVLRQLLLNPRLTERDVVELAARRPTTAEAQRVVASSRRFSSRYAVRRALVLNPHTPTDLAVRICALLKRDDLSSVAAETSAPPPVRDAARRLLAGRRHEPGG